ncbi:MAG TPA: TMEM175 family protein [Candidatus Angelobacter sp.]|nr:TMEM175 family protein [Candidatus Angelobacter sp.]
MNLTVKLPQEPLHGGVLLSKGRVEALTDGICAIAMTLLVLELKVPDLPRSVPAHELLKSLGEEAPVFLGFFFSFLYCGLLWFLHHVAMHFFRHMQTALVWLNLLFLMSISVLPFSCALLGRFHFKVAVLEIYFGNLFLAALLLLLQWLFARRRKLISEDDPLAARTVGLRLAALPIALATAMLATLYKPITAFYAMIFVLLAIRVWGKRSTAKKFAATVPSRSGF